MSLKLNVDKDIKHGESIQCFQVEHGGEKILIKFYFLKSTGQFKMSFDGPVSFRIHRFKEPLVRQIDSGD